jgi:hypothetical protein
MVSASSSRYPCCPALRGNKVPVTLACIPGSMFAVRGGAWSQLLHDQSVGPPPRVGFDRLDQFHPGPGFRVLDLLLESASLLPVALVAAGDLLFVTSPLAPSSSEFRDLLCRPVGAAVACSAAGYGARHRGIASCAHVPLQAFCFLVDAAFLRCPRIPIPRGYGDRRLEQVSVHLLQSPSWSWRWTGTVWTSGVAAVLSCGRSLRGKFHHYA